MTSPALFPNLYSAQPMPPPALPQIGTSDANKVWYSGDGAMTPLGYGGNGPSTAAPMPAPLPTPTPPMSAMAPMAASNPTNILDPNYKDPYTGATPANFDQIRANLGQPINMTPSLQSSSGDYQTILDNLAKSNETIRQRNMSEASALASRRGLAGSSIEQFGVRQASKSADEDLLNSQSNILLQKQQQQDSLQQLGMNLNNSRDMQMGQLTSDEIASLRNSDFSRQYAQIQKQLGEQGLDVQRQNISAQQDIARQQAQNQLISAGLGGLLPLLAGGGGLGGAGSLLGGGGTGGGGMLSGLLGGGMPSGMGVGGIPLANPGFFGQGGVLGSGLGPMGILGSAGLGYAGGALGNKLFGGGNDLGGFTGGAAGALMGGPVGAGVGAFLGTGVQRLGDKAYTSLQGSIGNTLASTLKPLVNPVGTISDVLSNPSKTISNIGSSISNAVSSVFPF